MVSGLIFKSLSHFKFIFVHSMRVCFNFIYLHAAVQLLLPLLNSLTCLIQWFKYQILKYLALPTLQISLSFCFSLMCHYAKAMNKMNAYLTNQTSAKKIC